MRLTKGISFFRKAKDGGPESSVMGYWLAEIKALFSIVLLRFDGASREAFHTHAFHSISWVLKGQLIEEMLDGRTYVLKPSLLPYLTARKDFHKVSSTTGRTWVLSFRGPWTPDWREYLPKENRGRTLLAGRIEA